MAAILRPILLHKTNHCLGLIDGLVQCVTTAS